MIHVGVSKQDKQISVEKRAFNDEYVLEDISCKCPEDKCCVRTASSQIIETGLDVDRLCEFSNKNFKYLRSKGKKPGFIINGFMMQFYYKRF